MRICSLWSNLRWLLTKKTISLYLVYLSLLFFINTEQILKKKGKTMKKYISPFLMLVLATWVMAPGWAQAGSGFYLSGDLGANFSKGCVISRERATTRTASVMQYLNEGLHRLMAACPGDRGDHSPKHPLSRIGIAAFDGGQGILGRSGRGLQFCGSEPEQPFGRISAWNWNTSIGNRNTISPRHLGMVCTCRPQ